MSCLSRSCLGPCCLGPCCSCGCPMALHCRAGLLQHVYLHLGQGVLQHRPPLLCPALCAWVAAAPITASCWPCTIDCFVGWVVARGRAELTAVPPAPAPAPTAPGQGCARGHVRLWAVAALAPARRHPPVLPAAWHTPPAARFAPAPAGTPSAAGPPGQPWCRGPGCHAAAQQCCQHDHPCAQLQPQPQHSTLNSNQDLACPPAHLHLLLVNSAAVLAAAGHQEEGRQEAGGRWLPLVGGQVGWCWCWRLAAEQAALCAGQWLGLWVEAGREQRRGQGWGWGAVPWVRVAYLQAWLLAGEGGGRGP
ncbi:hypothetical protein V8C86DRAFT_2492698, partial [Haematococcus lacustris]